MLWIVHGWAWFLSTSVISELKNERQDTKWYFKKSAKYRSFDQIRIWLVSTDGSLIGLVFIGFTDHVVQKQLCSQLPTVGGRVLPLCSADNARAGFYRCSCLNHSMRCRSGDNCVDQPENRGYQLERPKIAEISRNSRNLLRLSEKQLKFADICGPSWLR